MSGNDDWEKPTDNVELFFREEQERCVALTPTAALKVCKEAASRNLIILGLEGGICDPNGIQYRLDCIYEFWNKSPFISQEIAQVVNNEAHDVIKIESDEHDAFVLTFQKIVSGFGKMKNSTL